MRGNLHVLEEHEERDHTGLEIIKQEEARIHLHSKTFLCFNLDLTFKFALFPKRTDCIRLAKSDRKMAHTRNSKCN